MPKSQSSRLFLAAALLVCTWLLWHFTSPRPRTASEPQAPAKTASQQPANATPDVNLVASKPTPSAPAAIPSEDAPASAPPAKLPEMATLPANREQTVDLLDRLQLTLRDFRAANGGNPVGTNAEITKSLLGDNIRQTKHEIPEGTRLNANGELCDPWGTPYFFHQQSATKMEIRSAGPDHKMWTDDDVQL